MTHCEPEAVVSLMSPTARAMCEKCQLRARAVQQKSVFFDHIVSCHKQRLWDSEAERFRRLEVDRKHKTLPSALIEKEGYIVCDRMAGPNIDIGTIPLPPESKPQMIVLHVLRVRKIHICAFPDRWHDTGLVLHLLKVV
jgi:hypothetical protein